MVGPRDQIASNDPRHVPRPVRPIVQVIDTGTRTAIWASSSGPARRGKLLITSLDLRTDLDARPVPDKC